MATTTFNAEANFTNIEGTGYKSGVHSQVVDLFPGSSLDSNIWTVTGSSGATVTVSSGVMNISSDGTVLNQWKTGIISNKYTKVTGQSFYFRVRIPTGTAAGPNVTITDSAAPSYDTNDLGTGIYFRTVDNKLYLREDQTFANGGVYSWSLDTWYDVEIKILASTVEVYVDGNLIGTRTISYSNFYLYINSYGGATDEIDTYWVKDSEVDSYTLVNDSGETFHDAGAGKAWDNSTAADTDTGSPTIRYQYADYAADQSWSTAAAVEAGASWNGSWLTLAQLQAASDTEKRYRYLKVQLTQSAVTDTYDSYACDDYTAETTPPGVPTGTKTVIFDTDNYPLIWAEPADADYDHCELRRDIGGTTYYLNSVANIPTWQTSAGTPFKFADGIAVLGGWLQSNYVDEDVVGTPTYYVRSVDEIGNASAWTIFDIQTAGGAQLGAFENGAWR